MIVRSQIRPHPDTGERRDLQVDAPSYDEAVAQINEQTPVGWIRLWLATGPDESRAAGEQG